MAADPSCAYAPPGPTDCAAPPAPTPLPVPACAVPTTVPPQAQAPPACPPLVLAISGEPDGPERVENLIKLSFTLSPAPGSTAPAPGNTGADAVLPWCSVVIPTGIFSSPRSVFIHDEDVDVLAAMGRRFLVCRLQAVLDDAAAPGGLVPAVACAKCVQREVRKLASLAAAASLRAAKGTARDPLHVQDAKQEQQQQAQQAQQQAQQQQQAQIEGGASAFQQQLADALAATMVVVHSDPEVALARGASSFTLKVRLVCYSSHHGKRPFRILVTLWDSATRALVAQRASRPITVLDNHKNKARRAPAASSILSSAAPITILAPIGGSGGGASGVTGSITSSTIDSPWQQQQQQPSAAKRMRESSPGSDAAATPVLGAVKVTPGLATAPGSSLSSSSAPSPHAAGEYVLAAQPTVGTARARTFYKIVPASGSVGGGTPVTVLGQGFAPGDVLVFGAVPAPDTRLWSDGTLLCTLPPAEREGVVVVSVQGVPAACVHGDQLFTYTDDTDLRLFSHAFRLVDAMGNVTTGNSSPDGCDDFGGGVFGVGDGSNDVCATGSPRDAALRLVARMHALADDAAASAFVRALPEDVHNAEADEALLVRTLSAACARVPAETVVRVLAVPERDTGHTLLHLAAMRGYAQLSALLLRRAPALLTARDHAGCTALHHATLRAHAPVVALLLGPLRTTDAVVSDAARLITDAAVAREYQAAGVAVPGTPHASDGEDAPAPAPVPHYLADVDGVATAFDIVDVAAFPDSDPALLFDALPPPPLYPYGDGGYDNSDALPHVKMEELEVEDGDADGPREPPRKLYVTGVPDSSGGGGFSLRAQQALMFGVALVVGAAMVALVAARPHGFLRDGMPEHTTRSSGEDQWLSKLSEKNTRVLRVLSTICFGAVALLAVWFARQRSRALQAHAGVLGLSGLVMCIYEIVAIFAID